MAESVQIRIATKADAAIIALLARVTFTETFGHHFRDRQDLIDYLDHTFGMDKLETGLEKAENIFWLAYVGKLPVGYAKLKLNSPSKFKNGSRPCQLQKIYVLKDFLSMKIGYFLQETLLQKATALQFNWIWLSVLGSNLRAIRFYEKVGFEKIGDHAFSIGKENFEFVAMGMVLSEG